MLFQSCALKQAAARSVFGRRLLSDRTVKGKGKNKGTEIWTCLLSPTPFPPSLLPSVSGSSGSSSSSSEKFLEGSVECDRRQYRVCTATVGPVSFSLDVSILSLPLPLPLPGDL